VFTLLTKVLALLIVIAVFVATSVQVWTMWSYWRRRSEADGVRKIFTPSIQRGGWRGVLAPPSKTMPVTTDLLSQALPSKLVPKLVLVTLMMPAAGPPHRDTFE
jgi:hypothetical protein